MDGGMEASLFLLLEHTIWCVSIKAQQNRKNDWFTSRDNDGKYGEPCSDISYPIPNPVSSIFKVLSA